MNVFPDPRADAVAILKAAFPLPVTVSTSVAGSTIAAPHLQVLWDGTPSEQSNRQVAAVAVVAFGPSGRVSDAIATAQKAKAVLLDSGTASTWRYRPGPGPGIDTDNDTKLPRSEFTVYAETRATVL